ncbi:hypothetical protein M5K25_004141 [Dendrobium thyrsiflorum]|uniref:Uncharacterized protein n=1 Tax=Dendrobium thyrsiflorum TaxID=117978 RepID=A0ABD0VLY0_DENTH
MELRAAIASTYYGALGIDEADIFVSDGAKCDISRLLLLFGASVKIAVQDPSYPGTLRKVFEYKCLLISKIKTDIYYAIDASKVGENKRIYVWAISVWPCCSRFGLLGLLGSLWWSGILPFLFLSQYGFSFFPGGCLPPVLPVAGCLLVSRCLFASCASCDWLPVGFPLPVASRGWLSVRFLCVL